MTRLLIVAALLLIATVVISHLAARREDLDLMQAELTFADAEAAALRRRPGVVEDWVLTHPGDALHFRFKVAGADGVAYAVDVDAASGRVEDERLTLGSAPLKSDRP